MNSATIPLEKQSFNSGLQRLQQPVLPLVSMVQFLFLTGPFTTVAEVIDEMPSPIETPYTTYEHPRKLLYHHHQTLQLLESIKAGTDQEFQVISEQNEPVDTMTAVSTIVLQLILTDELEDINSLLCAPCGCKLCCIGPAPSMQQEFFEIPLKEAEKGLFAVDRVDTDESRSRCSMDEAPMAIHNAPFYKRKAPALFHWQNGWSLILPQSTICPNLQSEQGRCQVYVDRPEVCRRPQIFPYIVEKMDSESTPPQYRLRQSLLAIIDCPYVSLLQDEIAAYGAACELEVIFKQNKS